MSTLLNMFNLFNMSTFRHFPLRPNRPHSDAFKTGNLGQLHPVADMIYCFVKRLTPVVSEIILSGQLCSNGEKNILFGICNVISSFVNVALHHLHRASPKMIRRVTK